jgi:hypothetical protein
MSALDNVRFAQPAQPVVIDVSPMFLARADEVIE